MKYLNHLVYPSKGKFSKFRFVVRMRFKFNSNLHYLCVHRRSGRCLLDTLNLKVTGFKLKLCLKMESLQSLDIRKSSDFKLKVSLQRFLELCSKLQLATLLIRGPQEHKSTLPWKCLPSISSLNRRIFLSARTIREQSDGCHSPNQSH